MLPRFQRLRPLFSAAAAILAAAVFAFDTASSSEVSVATLYVLVVMLGAIGASAQTIRLWAVTCAALSLVSFALVHTGEFDGDSLFRLLFSLIAIGITTALLSSRYHLNETRHALQESRERLQTFADSVPQMLWGTRADGYCDFLNQRFTDITGLDRDEALREQTWTDPIHPDDLPGFLQAWETARGNEADLRFYFRVRHADGHYRWYLSEGRPVRSPQTGEVIRWFGGLSDVDDEINAQEIIRDLNLKLAQRVEESTTELAKAQARFQALYEDPNIGLVEFDLRRTRLLIDRLRADGVTDLRTHLESHPDVFTECLDSLRTVDVNDTMLRMFGYARKDEILGVFHTFSDAEGYLKSQLEPMFLRQKVVRGTHFLYGADRRRIPIAYAVNHVEGDMSYATIFDISERERAHEMILAAQEELARANRAATVGAFSVSIAHELNQPISSISMDVETSLRTLQRDPPDLDIVRRILERVKRNTQRLAAIVQRTRDQVARRRRVSSVVDLCRLVQETKSLLEREIDQRGGHLEWDCWGDCRVMGDPVEMQQVLINLIVNAFDAMEGQPVAARKVSVTIGPCEGETVRTTVADSGAGITEDDLTRIFEPFYSTKPGGIGMGLQICRATIEGLGGTLTVANRPEGGAAFTFDLPALDA